MLNEVLLDLEKLNVFMDLGKEVIPNCCCCGCGVGSVYKGSGKFNDEEQIKNYEKRGGYRFFANSSHIKRFKMLIQKR